MLHKTRSFVSMIFVNIVVFVIYGIINVSFPVNIVFLLNLKAYYQRVYVIIQCYFLLSNQ